MVGNQITAERLNRLVLGKRIVATVITDEEEWGAVIHRIHLEGGTVLYMTGRADRAQVDYIGKDRR